MHCCSFCIAGVIKPPKPVATSNAWWLLSKPAATASGGEWLCARGMEAYVIHPTSIPMSREQRRAKTDRLDVGLLKRALLGWLRDEKKHCSMAAIPTLREEDAERPHPERDQLVSQRTGVV